MTCKDGIHLNCTGEELKCGCIWEYCNECSHGECFQMCDECFNRISAEDEEYHH